MLCLLCAVCCLENQNIFLALTLTGALFCQVFQIASINCIPEAKFSGALKETSWYIGKLDSINQ